MDTSELPMGVLTRDVEHRTLDNGLTVLVRPVEGSPVAAVVTHVRTGYFHEPDEVAGISHVLEHMYFNGTERRPDPEQISRETKANGGSLNAGTIYDRTSYYVVLPHDRWQEALDIQADAFQNPLFDEEVLAKEMEAILQEARRKLDSPTAYGREKMYELAFDAHRMRRWRIGSEEVLRGLGRDDLVKWHEDHYRPANTIISVVGGVDPGEVFAEVERLYGSLPAGELRRRGGPGEPAQDSFRYAREHADIGRDYIFLGYHTPGVGHPDNAALDVLASIVGGDDASRITRRCKEELGVITTSSASAYQFEDVGLFTVEASCGVEDTERASREIITEIERVKLLGVLPGEVERALGRIEAAEAFALEEALGQASTLAHYEAEGGYRRLDAELAALRSVTAEDVQRVAREYLQLDNATLYEYVSHRQGSGRAPDEMAAHLRGALVAEAERMERPEPVEPGYTYLGDGVLEGWAPRLVLQRDPRPGTQRFELPQGATLLVRENAAAPTVSCGVHFRGGRLQEFRNSAGATHLLQRLMVKQTHNRDAAQLASEMALLGSGIARSHTDDHFGFRVASVDRYFARAFDVLFDVVANPKFDALQMDREKEAHISAMRRLEDQSPRLALQMVRQGMYEDHPYGFPELGSMRFVRASGQLRIEEHYSEVVRPETMVVSVAGNVDADAVAEFVSNYLRLFSADAEFAQPASAEAFFGQETIPVPSAPEAPAEARISRDRAQTAMIIGLPTVARHHPDRYALELLQATTGGLGGTFFEEVRSRRGLAYSVSTLDVQHALAGWWGTFVACSPDSQEIVRDLVIELTRGLAEDPPAGEALERAKGYLAGGYLVGMQANGAQAAAAADLELLGLDLSELELYPDHIRAVDEGQLAEVARRYFADGPAITAIVSGTPGQADTP